MLKFCLINPNNTHSVNCTKYLLLNLPVIGRRTCSSVWEDSSSSDIFIKPHFIFNYFCKYWNKFTNYICIKSNYLKYILILNYVVFFKYNLLLNMPNMIGTPTVFYKIRRPSIFWQYEHFDTINSTHSRYLVSATHYYAYFAANREVISLS